MYQESQQNQQEEIHSHSSSHLIQVLDKSAYKVMLETFISGDQTVCLKLKLLTIEQNVVENEHQIILESLSFNEMIAGKFHSLSQLGQYLQKKGNIDARLENKNITIFGKTQDHTTGKFNKYTLAQLFLSQVQIEKKQISTYLKDMRRNFQQKEQHNDMIDEKQEQKKTRVRSREYQKKDVQSKRTKRDAR